jgi:hypothetical protein
VTEFTYCDTAFTEHLCKVKHFDSYNEEWLDFVVMNRNTMLPQPAHDYDIVEGPVANDKVQRTLTRYLAGKISKEKFLKMLSYHEPTHQICFCTMRSLLVLDKAYNDSIFDIEDCAESIVEQLMLDYNFDEEKATDIFFSSNVFAQLSDEDAKLYLKNWKEIYDLLKKELGN